MAINGNQWHLRDQALTPSRGLMDHFRAHPVIPMLPGPGGRELARPQPAREQPAQPWEVARAQQLCGRLRCVSEPTEAVVIPSGDAPERRVHAQHRVAGEHVLHQIGREEQVVLDDDHGLLVRHQLVKREAQGAFVRCSDP